jgi:Bardet-Biedl syndrome 1 protein
MAERSRSPWLHAWHDPVSDIKAYSNCLCLADLNGDGDNKILIADMERKLKIYKGTTLVSEHALLDVPVALCAFYSDTNIPRTPAVAVASGPYVFIYRNLRPYFKFTLPPVEIDRQELDVWNELQSSNITAANAYELLSVARDNGSQLSGRSMDLLQLNTEEEQNDFVTSCKNAPLTQQTVITCMGTLKKNMEDEDAVSSLVIGTESKKVLILSANGSQILHSCTLKGVPVHIAITGLLDVDYRIVIACRNGNVYTIKNGEVAGNVIELETQICGLVRLDNNIIVSCMDNNIHSFHIKGKKNYSIYLPQAVTNMCPLHIRKTRVVNALLVALQDGTVRLYNGKHLVNELKTGEAITGMCFGQFGREESSLVLLHRSGALTIKMLQRQANLEVSSAPAGPPPEQDIALNVPKKTKLYVEQTERERNQATEMHRIFQRDLCKLRLSTARSYVKIITDGHGPVSYSSGASLRLNAQVQGLGPHFKIKLNIQNAGTKPMINVPLTCGYNHQLYKLSKALLRIPLVIPVFCFCLYVSPPSIESC